MQSLTESLGEQSGTAYAVNLQATLSANTKFGGMTTSIEYPISLSMVLDTAGVSLTVTALDQTVCAIMTNQTLYMQVGDTLLKTTFDAETVSKAITSLLGDILQEIQIGDFDLASLIQQVPMEWEYQPGLFPSTVLPNGNMQWHLTDFDNLAGIIGGGIIDGDDGDSIGDDLLSLPESVDISFDKDANERLCALVAKIAIQMQNGDTTIDLTMTTDALSAQTVKAPENADDFVFVDIDDILNGNDNDISPDLPDYEGGDNPSYNESDSF